MKTKIKILLAFVLLFSFWISGAFASDLDEVRIRVNQLQGSDPSLPTWVEQKGLVGTILSLVFDANGIIKNDFLNIWSIISSVSSAIAPSLNPNYVSKWNGTNFVNSILFDNGANVWIGTSSPSAKLDVVGGVEVNGTLDVNGNADISGTLHVTWTVSASDPSAGSDLTTKSYVDTLVGWSHIWQENGSDIYYSAGNVGINTSSPSADFHVNGNIQANQINVTCIGNCF